MKYNVNKWKDITYLWIERLNVVKIAICSKLIYRANIMPIKISAGFSFFSFFQKNNKLIQKFSWRCEEPRIGKII